MPSPSWMKSIPKLCQSFTKIQSSLVTGSHKNHYISVSKMSSPNSKLYSKFKILPSPVQAVPESLLLLNMSAPSFHLLPTVPVSSKGPLHGFCKDFPSGNVLVQLPLVRAQAKPLQVITQNACPPSSLCV